MKADADKSGWYSWPDSRGAGSCSLLEGRGARPWEGLRPALL